MAAFIGTFVNKIDSKGRVSVPATFRALLAGQSYHGITALRWWKYSAIRCAGMNWVDGLVAKVGNMYDFSDEQDDLTAVLFPDTRSLPFDGEGRVVLPDDLAQHARLDGVAAFVGRGPFFEIWEPAAFEAYRAEALRRTIEKGRTLPPLPGERS